MDPIYIYMDAYPTSLPNLFLPLRYLFLIFVPNWANVGIRTVLLITFQTSLKFFIALSNLKHKFPLSKSAITLYKQLLIERNILKPYEAIIFIAYTPISFLILVGCFSFLLLSLKFNVQLEVFLTFLGIAVVTFGMTVPVYSTGCHLYLYSMKIVERWKRLLTMQIRMNPEY